LSLPRCLTMISGRACKSNRSRRRFRRVGNTGARRAQRSPRYPRRRDEHGPKSRGDLCPLPSRRGQERKHGRLRRRAGQKTVSSWAQESRPTSRQGPTRRGTWLNISGTLAR
jgi:hypothetical protein